jgi:hypothetical protein
MLKNPSTMRKLQKEIDDMEAKGWISDPGYIPTVLQNAVSPGCYERSYEVSILLLLFFISDCIPPRD